MDESCSSASRMSWDGNMYPLRTIERRDSSESSMTIDAARVDNNGRDRHPLLEVIDHELVEQTGERDVEAMVVGRSLKWYNSPVWAILFMVLLLAIVMREGIYLFIAPSCGFESGFATDLAYLAPPTILHTTRFTGAIRATADGNGLHVPQPAVDSHGRRFTGPPAPSVDAAWHDLTYGRYIAFTPTELTWLNTDTFVPSLLPVQPTRDAETNTTLVTESAFYGGPDMLHSLHCLNGLRKHLPHNHHYYNHNIFTPEGVDHEFYERMHIDHCLEQLRQAVLCHGDMTPVTLRPVKNGEGETWALLGETEREHVCRDGEALGRAWRDRAGEGGRVESE